MSEICFSKDDLIASLDGLTYEVFVSLMGDLFKQVCVESFVYGNVSRKKAISLLEDVESALRNVGTKPIAPVDRLRLVSLAEGWGCFSLFSQRFWNLLESLVLNRSIFSVPYLSGVLDRFGVGLSSGKPRPQELLRHHVLPVRVRKSADECPPGIV